MTANPTLVKMRGIDEESVKQINLLHEKLDKLMSRANLGVFNQSVYDGIETIENQLQLLWGFGIDKSMHTYKHLYKFRSQWVNRVFQCKTTGETFTIPENVKERDFFRVGQGFVDTGVLDGYARFSNVIEISNENITLD
jgi:hypothetical protein